jgi:hypothetical protein
VVACVNHVVCVISPVVVPGMCQELLLVCHAMDYLPVKRQGIAWCYLDRVCSLNVAHDIASQINGVQVLDW